MLGDSFIQIRVCTYNLENLFIKEAIPEYESPHFFKTDDKLDDLKVVFDDIDADIYALQEVGFIESLYYFNTHYLNEEYEVFHVKGNSGRNIEIAYLVKKLITKNFTLRLKSHHKGIIPCPYTEEEMHYLSQKGFSENFKMSRGLLELSIKKDKDIILKLFNVHLKSARDDTGIDFRSNKRRRSELLYSLDTMKRMDENIPMILLGDLNGNASDLNTEKEFDQIYKRNFADVLSPFKLPLEHRATFFAFNKRRRVPIQLDYAFIQENFLDKIYDPLIYRYKNEFDRPRPFPRGKTDVNKYPSDHYPLVFTFLL